MKFHILSDLHLEFHKWPRSVPVRAIDADVTILAGDIGVGLQGIEWALESFDRPVIYVMGNHEFYGQRPMTKTLEKARHKCQGTHVHLLDNESVVIDGVRFLGTTLWTDFALFGSELRGEVMAYVRREMTDYQVIYRSRRGHVIEPGASKARQGDRLTPAAVLGLHETARSFLETELGRDPTTEHPWRTTVVVSHHAPSFRSLPDGSATGWLDAAYASNLEPLIERAALWVHGHTHHVTDYLLGEGRVISNPRDFERPHQTTDVTREIKALRFSKIVLEMLFSIPYHCNEFR